jgi:hypothetical protein
MKNSTKIRRRSASVVGAGALALLAAAPGIASADTAPPIWQVGGSSFATLGDTHNVGTLSFFDLNGNQITTGPANAGFGYVEVDGLPVSDLISSKKFVYLTAATPTPAEPAGTFPTAALSVKTQWPNASAPGTLATDTNPVFSGPVAAAAVVPQNDSLDTYASGDKAQTSTTAGYTGVYEIRAFLTGTGGSEADYASADVQVVNDVWTQIFPAATVVTTPPTSLPEAPVAALIPLSALVVAGGVVVSRRRRSSAANTIR